MPLSMLALLDDVSALSKSAIRKTVAMSTDDLAVNAGTVNGLNPEREWPIIGRVALASLRNKAILVPAALLIPNWLIGTILGVGGVFLCYEGLAHTQDTEEQAAACETTRIREAAATDFVLSAEITAVTLGSVSSEPLLVKTAVIGSVGLAMTILVYGAVACLVKIDDVGRWLKGKGWNNSGGAMEQSSPWILSFLGHIGRMAMLSVGGNLVFGHVLDVELSWWQAAVAGACVGWTLQQVETYVRFLSADVSDAK